MKTIGSALDHYQGIGPGFDFLRVTLAVTIIMHHSFLVVDGNTDFIDQHHLWAILGVPVPMFFALSGFLVSGSALRLRLRDFWINRGLRIVPALAVDIFISALLIGPLVTVVPISEYYTDKKFLHYLLNIVGFIHYELPGVFVNNQFPNQVNGSVWTVPLEMGSYTIMSLLIVLGCVRSKTRMVAAVVAFTALYYALMLYFTDHASPIAGDAAWQHYMLNFLGERGNYLFFYFIGGSFTYVFRYQIPFSKWLALAIAAIVVANFGGALPLGMAKPAMMALPIAYLVAFIGLCPIPKLPVYSRGDYSYGIYLYAYPLQQLLVMVFPGIAVLVHFVLSIVAVTCVAMCSWHIVEKPILSARRKFSYTAHKGDNDKLELVNIPPSQ